MLQGVAKLAWRWSKHLIDRYLYRQYCRGYRRGKVADTRKKVDCVREMKCLILMAWMTNSDRIREK